MAKLSVIVPWCQEWPQVAFTLKNISEELEGRCDYEVIAVDNWCKEAEISQKRLPDRSHDRYKGPNNKFYGIYRQPSNTTLIAGMIRGAADLNPWLRYLHYEEKLSTWNCRRLAAEESTGEYLFFTDSHVVLKRDALYDMFQYYLEHEEELDGTMHLPLTYQILDPQKLIYKFVPDEPKGYLGYSFHKPGANMPAEPFEVSCMSSCGFIVSKKIYNLMGGFPRALGAYGGGENFLNFVLAILGKKKWIYPAGCLHHHGERRGYSTTGESINYNRAVAVYMFGGMPWLTRYLTKSLGLSRLNANQWRDKVVEPCLAQRKHIKERTQISIEEWVAKWPPLKP